MTNEEIAAELERLNEKATPGPWKAGRPDMLSSAVLSDGEVGEMGKYVYRQMDAPVDDPMFGAFHIPEPNSIEDAQLIVFYRAHHAAIVSALRDVARMRAELDGGMFVPISEWNITIAERAALAKAREALRKHVVHQSVRLAHGGGVVPNGHYCGICRSECDPGEELVHEPTCILATPTPTPVREQ